MRVFTLHTTRTCKLKTFLGFSCFIVFLFQKFLIFFHFSFFLFFFFPSSSFLMDAIKSVCIITQTCTELPANQEHADLETWACATPKSTHTSPGKNKTAIITMSIAPPPLAINTGKTSDPRKMQPLPHT